MSMTTKAITPRPGQPDSLHDSDFYTWTRRQAELIRAGRLDEADLETIAEEIEDLGSNKEAGLEAAYRLISCHLLKLMLQPDRATRSWTLTIQEQRNRLERLLRKNPGLKSKRDQLFAEAYQDARREAEDDTALPFATFPQDPPFTREQVEDRAFWP